MAGFAARRCSICAQLLHALGKLTFVRILVAGHAREIFPVIEHDRLRTAFRVCLLLVAIAAWHRHVSVGQDKPCLFMPRQRERRRLVSLQRVATFARVQIRSRSELPVVLIFMAIGAALELDLE